MIKFTNAEDNKQFLSLVFDTETPPEILFSKVYNIYPVLEKVFYKADNNEMLFGILPNINYGFSLNELRQKLIDYLPPSQISTFTVDLHIPEQRFC